MRLDGRDEMDETGVGSDQLDQLLASIAWTRFEIAEVLGDVDDLISELDQTVAPGSQARLPARQDAGRPGRRRPTDA